MFHILCELINSQLTYRYEVHILTICEFETREGKKTIFLFDFNRRNSFSLFFFIDKSNITPCYVGYRFEYYTLSEMRLNRAKCTK